LSVFNSLPIVVGRSRAQVHCGSIGSGIARFDVLRRPDTKRDERRKLRQHVLVRVRGPDVGDYSFVPVRLFMKDQFRSDLRVGKVRTPVLVVHGDNDAVVP